MNIIFFTANPVISNLVKNILSTDNITVSTNPNGFINSDYDMVMVDYNLFTRNLMNLNIPVLYFNHNRMMSLCNEVVVLGGHCIDIPFTREQLLSKISLLSQQPNNSI